MWRSDRIPSAYPITALDYHWWWTSFASGAAPALWMAGYGMVHYWCSSHSLDLMGGCVYILRMFLGCCLVGTLSGTIGFFSAYAMVKKVYSSIKTYSV
ncbi:hypothetical protein BDF14DRAFT_997396 [Spinellus fusiger]|nr:hypothetical protein BDF14DRAFT_997396 [Spinellus fusiger]